VKTEIKIGAVTRKEGTSKKTGKPWTKYVIHSDADATFETFDAGIAQKAHEHVGQRATVEFEVGQYGNDLKTLELSGANGSFPVEQIPSEKTPDGDTDWDLIGLRKTRCLLWAHYLAAAAREIPAQSLVAADGTLLDGIYKTGVRLISCAERDIYHRAPAADTEDVPF